MAHFTIDKTAPWYNALTIAEAQEVTALEKIIEAVDLAREEAMKRRYVIQKRATNREAAKVGRAHSAKFRG